MSQDPTLFTAFEWVLLSMAGGLSLVLFAIVHRARRGSPFSKRDETWFRENNAAGQQPTEKH